MILRRGTLQPKMRDADEVARFGHCQRVQVSDAGGLTQFGLALETLGPGARSSQRHWHEAEDEFLLMLDGTATLVDEDGATPVPPGAAVCWPAGLANAHQMQNRGETAISYLILGARIVPEVVHYPDEGEVLRDGPQGWQVTDATGAVVRSGPMPAHLTNLIPRTRPVLSPSTPVAILTPDLVRLDRGTPAQNAVMGEYEARLYSDTGGLAQFGAFVETLQPGARSSDRHWHEAEDECLYMLTGAATAIENDGPHLLGPGDAACWPAGVANGHFVVNRSVAPCSYLIVGSRLPSDLVHYSDTDKLYRRVDGVVHRTRRDGSPL